MNLFDIGLKVLATTLPEGPWTLAAFSTLKLPANVLDIMVSVVLGCHLCAISDPLV